MVIEDFRLLGILKVVKSVYNRSCAVRALLSFVLDLISKAIIDERVRLVAYPIHVPIFCTQKIQSSRLSSEFIPQDSYGQLVPHEMRHL